MVDGNECDVVAVWVYVHSNVTLNQEVSLYRMTPVLRNVPEQVLDGEAHKIMTYFMFCDAVAHRYLHVTNLFGGKDAERLVWKCPAVRG